MLTKKNLYINLSQSEAYIVDDAKENLKYSKAYKYLEGYTQDNNNFIELLKDIKMIEKDYLEEEELENLEKYHIEEITAKGYSQWDWQDWEFFFDKAILKDKETLEELKYFLQDLKYYFTEEGICYSGYIEHIKVIDWEEYKRREELDSICTCFMEYSIEERKEYLIEYIKGNWLEPKEYNIICDLENIEYSN